MGTLAAADFARLLPTPSHGSYVDPSLGLSATAGIRGVFTEEGASIHEGGSLLAVKRSSEFTAASSLFELLTVFLTVMLEAAARGDRPTSTMPLSSELAGFRIPPTLLEPSDATMDRQLGIMAAHLVYERRLPGLNTRFSPWLALWPTECSNAICKAGAQGDGTQDTSVIRERYATLGQQLGIVPRQDFLVAVSNVQSRSFFNPARQRRTVVPLIDFINHRPGAPQVRYNSSHYVVAPSATPASLAPGAEIFISYSEGRSLPHSRFEELFGFSSSAEPPT